MHVQGLRHLLQLILRHFLLSILSFTAHLRSPAEHQSLPLMSWNVSHRTWQWSVSECVQQQWFMTQQKGVRCPQAEPGPHRRVGRAACQTAPEGRWHQKALQCPSMWLPRSALQLPCSIRLQYVSLMPLLVCLLDSGHQSVFPSVCLPVFTSVCHDLCSRQLPEAPVTASRSAIAYQGFQSA